MLFRSKVFNQGVYYLTAENKNGCQTIDSIVVYVKPPPDAKIITEGNTKFCEGDSVKLSAAPSEPGYHYLWSTGDTLSYIYAKSEGKYSVTVFVTQGCKDSASISLQTIPMEQVEIITNGKTEICPGDSVKLTANPSSNEYTYLWSSGETGPAINVIVEGTHSLTIENEYGCKSTDFIEVKFHIPQEVKIQSSGPATLCKGSSTVLSSNQKFSKYLWSTGDTTETIRVGEPGSYFLTVVDSNGCNSVSQPLEINVIESEVKFSDNLNSQIHSVKIGYSDERTFYLTNVTSFPENIAAVYLKNNSSIITVTTSPQVPKILDVDDTIFVTLKTSPPDIKEYYDELIIEIDNPCYLKLIIPITVSTIAKTEVWLPDTVGVIGTKDFVIPLKARLVTDKDIYLDVSFSADISFNPTFFFPDEKFPLIGNERVVTFRSENVRLTKEEITLAELSGMVLLGDAKSTSLRISNFTWNNDLIEIRKKHGSLEVTGICQPEISVVNRFAITMLSIAPNPVEYSTNIKIETSEFGSFTLSISNVNGEVAELNKFDNNSLSKELLFETSMNTENFSQGMYFLILSTPNQRIVKPFFIIK